jgi:YidC/Oxa1 family membrane protein insertase
VSFSLDVFHYVFQEPIYNILMLFYGIFHSFWFAIVLLTLLLRAALIPLVFKQLQSTKVMQELGPQLKEIQRKYRGEPQEMMRQQQALYKANNYNPYASCLPMLVQLPFIYGLYGALNTILRGHPKPADLNSQLYPFIQPIFGPHGLLHLPNTNFFSINLANVDPTHILPILAALLTFMQLRMSLKRQAAQVQPRTTGGPDPNAATMKMMQYIMPFFTLFIAWNFPSGLALYWIVTTAFSVVQQYFFNGRSFGGLFDGIPGLAHLGGAPTAAAVVGTGNRVVDSTLGASPNRPRNRATAVEEKQPPAKNAPNKPRALPAVVDAAMRRGPGTNGTNGTHGVNGTNGVAKTNGQSANSATPSRPVAKPAPTRTPTTPVKKDAVRLVTPQANGTGTGSVPLTRVPKPTTGAMPRVNTVKPKTTSSTARPKKKAGK